MKHSTAIRYGTRLNQLITVARKESCSVVSIDCFQGFYYFHGVIRPLLLGTATNNDNGLRHLLSEERLKKGCARSRIAQVLINKN